MENCVTVIEGVVCPVDHWYDENVAGTLSVIGVPVQAVAGPEIVTAGGGSIGTVAVPLLVHEPFVTVTPRATLPLALAEKVIELVFWPAVIVPLVIVQKYDDAPAVTDAVFPVDDAQTVAGAVIVAAGFGVTVTVCESLPVQPLPSVTLTL